MALSVSDSDSSGSLDDDLSVDDVIRNRPQRLPMEQSFVGASAPVKNNTASTPEDKGWFSRFIDDKKRKKKGNRKTLKTAAASDDAANAETSKLKQKYQQAANLFDTKWLTEYIRNQIIQKKQAIATPKQPSSLQDTTTCDSSTNKMTTLETQNCGENCAEAVCLEREGNGTS